MLKRSLLTLILTLSISGWLLGCSSPENSEISDFSESTDSPRTVTGIIPNRAIETPDQPAVPALPPPASVESFLDEAHQQYADFSGTPKHSVEKCWENSGHVSPFEYSDPTFLNGFFNFTFCADLEIQISLEKSKASVKLATEALKASDLPGFRIAIRTLTAENQSIRQRILKAASYYQVSLSEYAYSPKGSGANFDKFSLATDTIFLQIPKPKGVIFLDDTVMDDVQNLVQSISLLFNASGSNEMVSFENFAPIDSTFPMLNILFAFESGQGGFGLTKTENIHFSVP